MDLPRPKEEDAASVRFRAAKITLQKMRSQGHDYLDLRQDGKRTIYLCILCHKPCYSEPILFQHLDGNGHKKMLTKAHLTMRLRNPWPFNDGIVFFNPARDDEPSGGQVRFIEATSCSSSKNAAGAIVKSNGNVNDGSDDYSTNSDSGDCVSDGLDGEKNLTLVVPRVLWKGDICDIEVKYIGLAKIGARFYKEKNNNDSADKIRRIWCEWLGNKTIDDDEDLSSSCPSLDFAVVTLRYDMSLSMGWETETEEIKYIGSKQKKRKSYFDPQVNSVSLVNYNNSDSGGTSCQENFASQPHLPLNSTVPLVNMPSDELSLTGSTSNKDLRIEIRKRQRVAVRRMCEVCKHKMHPGKDVAALLNLKTGKLFCSSRNVNGAFHVFHVSCLLQWILLCEYETLTSPVKSPKQRKCVSKKKRMTTKMNSDSRIQYLVCPACQGTGKHIKGAILEMNPIPPSQMFKYIIQTFAGRREWTKDPEILENCSIGLHYPPKSEEIVEELSAALGLLRFFTVDNPEWGKYMLQGI